MRWVWKSGPVLVLRVHQGDAQAGAAALPTLRQTTGKRHRVRKLPADA